MPARAALEPVYHPSRDRWRVDVPASRTPEGKRVRAHFKTRQAAREYIARFEGPTPAAAIDPRLAVDADTARQRIEAAGLNVTLAEVAAAYVEATKVLGGAGTLLSAVREFRRQHDARTASKPLGEAVAAFMEAKEGTIREATRKSYAYTLESTLKPLHEEALSDITAEALGKILGEKRPTARAMHLRNLRVFWRWASREPRGWATVAPVDALEYRREAGEADIAILRPNDVRALLKAAEGFSPNAAVAYAISIFAGVRQAELERLTWSDIREEYVEIGASIAKKGKRRMIPISPVLRAWLDAYTPPGVDRGDFIVGSNWREVSRAVRRLAGWNVSARILSNPPQATRGKWPANAPRHTCASVLVATGEPLETLIFQFGHSGGHDLLRRHYVGRLTKKDALAIMSIGPRGEKLPTIEAA